MEMDAFIRQLPKLTPGGLYLFAGPETYCTQQALHMLKDKLVPPETEAFDYLLLRGDETDPRQILSALEPLPFMAERRLVVVTDAPWFASGRKGEGEKPAKGREDIRSRFDRGLHEGLCLVFTGRELPNARSPWVKWVKDRGEVVECKPLEAAASLPWLARMARLEGVTLPRDAGLYLWEYTGGGLQKLSAEMHKLAAAVGQGGTITRETVQRYAVEAPEYKLFRCLEGLLSDSPGEGLAGVWHMLEEGTYPLAVLSMIEGQLRAIAFADWVREAGMSVQEAAPLLDTRDFVLRDAMHKRRRITSEKARLLLPRCRQADEDVKQGLVGDREALDDLLRQLVSL